jgi:hypothetical protein
MYLTRLERIKKEGSPYYTWQVPATGPGATSQIDLFTQFPLARKYMPLDWLEIVNNDTVNCTLLLNGPGGDALAVPAGTSRPIRGHKSMNQVGVRNDDAAATSTLNLITVTLRREPITVDDVARGLA